MSVAYALGRVIVDLYAEEIGRPLRDVQSFHKYLGGSAGNTAVGMARLGDDVGLISRVGSDEFGLFLRARLQQEKVDDAQVISDPRHPTGLAFAALLPPNDSQVLFYRKPCADAHVCVEDIDPEAFRNGPLLVVACTALARSPGREAALYALELTRAAGGITVLDIDWRAGFWSSPQEARVIYHAALRLADVVLANEPELEFAAGTANPAEAAQRLLSFGPRQVVAKRGGDGCLYFGEGGSARVPAYPIKVLNTLGAGDAFGAAYCHGLLQGWPTEERLAFASAAGALVVSRHSCSEAMPYAAEVSALMGQSSAS